MKLYDTLTGNLVEITQKQVNIYNCGPTVYNDIHIGNARPLIVFDVIYRTLEACHKEVRYLHNLTDIDDKIINAAKSAGVPELTLSAKYGEAYAKIREQLNTKPLIIEKVSDNIDGIIDYIGRLLKAKAAYTIDGNVYFDTSCDPSYGSLSKRNLSEQYIGERVNKDDAKHNETDFVLWKKTKDGIQWETPWSKGRPGWHSECSYLIEKYFKNELTIHGGGVDLKFPHHENENAQHECLHHQGLAKIWAHVGHINVNHEKMSKSLNNFILVKDLLNVYSYQVIRWFMYATNYRNPLDFNNEIMKKCQDDINKIKLAINQAKSYLIVNKKLVLKPVVSTEVLAHLENDLDIANAVTTIWKINKQLNILIRNKAFDDASFQLNQLIGSLQILGIEFEDLHTTENVQLITEYFKLINEKEFAKSDDLRKELIIKGLL